MMYYRPGFSFSLAGQFAFIRMGMRHEEMGKKRSPVFGVLSCTKLQVSRTIRYLEAR